MVGPPCRGGLWGAWNAERKATPTVHLVFVPRFMCAACRAAHIKRHKSQSHPTTVPRGPAAAASGVSSLSGAERVILCSLLREIFGNPFRPVEFDPEWRTDTALTLAR